MSGSREKPATRTSSEIFHDLRALLHRAGALHCISAVVHRDWVFEIDRREGKVLQDADQRWSIEKINKNELMLLVGILIQSTSDTTYTHLPEDTETIGIIDKLLGEFHDVLLIDFRTMFTEKVASPKNGDSAQAEFSIGSFAREAIYYGAESFYLGQLEHFAKHRYRRDRDWLLENIGISIKKILQIARFIKNRVNNQITAAQLISKTGLPDFGLLTSSLTVPKEVLRDHFRSDADKFLKVFSTPSTNANLAFQDPFQINEANLRPLVDIGDFIFVPSQYRLFESIYESPFYWMMSHKEYKNIEAEHRGEFLETTAERLLASVFDKRHVFRNVLAHKTKKEIGAEADALIVYGEFIIVVQAKSKRLTLKARSGDVESLQADFKATIEDPYRQALQFSKYMQSGCDCSSAGTTIAIPKNPRVFSLILLSDSFPSITILASTIISSDAGIPPVIWDIGMLDCVIKLLPTPIDFIYYLKCRSDNFSRMHSDSEHNFIGFHIAHKLAVGPEADYVMIEKDFASLVDDFMISLEVGAKPKRPISILERLSIPIISDLLRKLRNSDPAMAAIVADFYDHSSKSLHQIGTEIERLRDEVISQKELKALSIPTPHGGISYVACRKLEDRTITSAELIGRKHKYDQKRDRWYVILDCVNTKRTVDVVLPLLEPWKEDAEEARVSEEVARHFGSIYRKPSDGIG